MNLVVTGANRGIGLEFVRQLLERGDEVDATARVPDRAEALRALSGNLRIHRVDVTSEADVAELARTIGHRPIDLVIHCAGVWGGPRQSVADCDFVEAVRTYEVNALGALRVALGLLPQIRKGSVKKLVHITSGMGSIADNGSGGSYAYRMSKAALNMMSRSLAVDLRAEGISSYVMNPGWVKTDMGGPNAPTPVDVSVRGMLKEIGQATSQESGEFLNWKGGRYPW